MSKYLNTSHSSRLFQKPLLLASNIGHRYNLSSSYNIIPLQSYKSLIHLTNYISHNLSIHISHIYYKHISHQVFTLITHTYYKYYIPQNIYIFYHLHTSQEISNTHTKSPSHGRHKDYLQKPFSWKVLTSNT